MEKQLPLIESINPNVILQVALTSRLCDDDNLHSSFSDHRLLSQLMHPGNCILPAYVRYELITRAQDIGGGPD